MTSRSKFPLSPDEPKHKPTCARANGPHGWKESVACTCGAALESLIRAAFAAGMNYADGVNERGIETVWQMRKDDLVPPVPPQAATPSQRDALEELVRTAAEVHRISHRTHEAWTALAEALKEARAVMTQPDEFDEPVTYDIEYALRIAHLWRAGKLIGADQDGVREALLTEVERLRKGP